MIIIGFYLMVFPLVVLAADVATIKKRNSVSIINVDVTNTMEDVIGEMMNTFHKTSQQWYENQLILDLDEYRSEDEDMPSTQSKNYSISHGKIWMTQFLNEKNEMFSKISCQFSDTLEVRTIIPDFQFRGSFNMTNNENPTVLVYNYIVDIKNINLTFTTEPDFNIEDALPNNQSKVDISYGQVNINFETSDQDIRDDTYGFEELRERLKKIKSSLRTSIIEKLTSHIKSPIHSYVSLYSICMNPRNDITRYHRTFDSQEEQHYYEISDIPSASCDFLNLQVAPIKIRGLWNFDFLNVKLSKKEMLYRTYSPRCGRYIYSSNVYDFDLRIINIEGETKWVIKENIDYNVTKWNDLNFTIDYLSISGNTWECSSSNDIRVDFHLLLEDEDNSDYWSNLFRKMILKRIQPVLRNTFRKTIFKKFSQLESSNPYY